MANTLITCSPVTHLQLAFDGQWETSLSVGRDNTCITELGAWLSSGSSDLSIEAFYSVANHSEFIGVRFATLASERQREVAFQLVEAFVARNIETSNAFVERVELLLAVSLFDASPSFLELGKVNAWRSFGAIVFWPDQTGRAPLICLEDALAANTRYREPSALPYAIELGFSGRFPYWLGSSISERVNSAYVISDTLASSLLSRV